MSPRLGPRLCPPAFDRLHASSAIVVAAREDHDHCPIPIAPRYGLEDDIGCRTNEVNRGRIGQCEGAVRFDYKMMVGRRDVYRTRSQHGAVARLTHLHGRAATEDIGQQALVFWSQVLHDNNGRRKSRRKSAEYLAHRIKPAR